MGGQPLRDWGLLFLILKFRVIFCVPTCCYMLVGQRLGSRIKLWDNLWLPCKGMIWPVCAAARKNICTMARRSAREGGGSAGKKLDIAMFSEKGIMAQMEQREP